MFELISALSELLASWRFYLCAIPGIAVAIYLGTDPERELLAWLVGAPSVVVGVCAGIYWEWRSR